MGTITKVNAWKVDYSEERKKSYLQYLDHMFENKIGLSNGELCRLFERYMGVFFGSKCQVTTSGTSAYEAMLSYFREKGYTDVITQGLCYTTDWIIPQRLGMDVHVVDVEKGTNSIDMNAVTDLLDGGLKDRKTVIVPVWMYGFFDAKKSHDIITLATKYDARIISDICHCHGSASGGFSNGFTSFMASKMLSCGEGGAIFSEDREMNDWLRSAIELGRVGRRTVVDGNNWKMSDLCAAFGLSGLGNVTSHIYRCLAIYRQYKDYLMKSKTVGIVNVKDSIYNGYICPMHISKGTREWWESHLMYDYGIETWFATSRYLPTDEPVFGGVVYGDLANSKETIDTTVFLPQHPFMTNEQIEYVCKSIKELEGKL